MDNSIDNVFDNMESVMILFIPLISLLGGILLVFGIFKIYTMFQNPENESQAGVFYTVIGIVFLFTSSIVSMSSENEVSVDLNKSDVGGVTIYDALSNLFFFFGLILLVMIVGFLIFYLKERYALAKQKPKFEEIRNKKLNELYEIRMIIDDIKVKNETNVKVIDIDQLNKMDRLFENYLERIKTLTHSDNDYLININFNDLLKIINLYKY